MSNPMVSDAYRGVRTRVTELVRAASPDALDAPAPATPKWRVRDVLAHFVGVTDDVLAGRLDGIATDPWTDAQVDARRDATPAEMLAEWAEKGPPFGDLLADAPFEISGQALFDAATHEHDVRQALGVPGARGSEAVVLAWQWFVGARTRGGGAAICFVTEGGREIAGLGEPIATVEASRFELARAVTGRRTAKEIAAYGWDCEPTPELLLASPIFSLRTESLNE